MTVTTFVVKNQDFLALFELETSCWPFSSSSLAWNSPGISMLLFLANSRISHLEKEWLESHPWLYDWWKQPTHTHTKQKVSGWYAVELALRLALSASLDDSNLYAVPIVNTCKPEREWPCNSWNKPPVMSSALVPKAWHLDFTSSMVVEAAFIHFVRNVLRLLVNSLPKCSIPTVDKSPKCCSCHDVTCRANCEIISDFNRAASSFQIATIRSLPNVDSECPKVSKR